MYKASALWKNLPVCYAGTRIEKAFRREGSHVYTSFSDLCAPDSAPAVCSLVASNHDLHKFCLASAHTVHCKCL